MAITATNENFAGIIASSKPVVVDFWATWCGPCRVLAPVVEEVGAQYADKADIVKCNVDECEDIAMQYGIRNIPTLLYFKDGKVVDRPVGVVAAEELVRRIESML